MKVREATPDREVDAAQQVWSTGEYERIANLPEIRPYTAFGCGRIELANPLHDAHRLYMGDGVGFLFLKQQPGIYHLHTVSEPGVRPKERYRAARAAARRLFSETDALSIYTMTPHDAPHAAPPRTFGFQKWFSRNAALNRRGVAVGADYYRLDVDRWRDPQHAELGAWLHSLAEQTKDDQHPFDFAHDIEVGRAMALILGGAIDKAVALFNTWALFAGYAPVRRIEGGVETPEEKILFSKSSVEIVPCR